MSKHPAGRKHYEERTETSSEQHLPHEPQLVRGAPKRPKSSATAKAGMGFESQASTRSWYSASTSGKQMGKYVTEQQAETDPEKDRVYKKA
jgi:hypothetical protein